MKSKHLQCEVWVPLNFLLFKYHVILFNQPFTAVGLRRGSLGPIVQTLLKCSFPIRVSECIFCYKDFTKEDFLTLTTSKKSNESNRTSGEKKQLLPNIFDVANCSLKHIVRKQRPSLRYFSQLTEI